MTILGFTGTRVGMTEDQKSACRAMISLMSGELHHGDCVGADAEMHDIVVDSGRFKTIIHPPNTNAFRAFKKGTIILPPRPYLERNEDIVDASHVLLATPKDFGEQQSGGTWYTIRYAIEQKRDVVVVLPDGSANLHYAPRIGH